MAYEFTFLLLVDHECLRKLTQDIDPRLCSVGRSKLLQSLIPTETQLVERSMIGSLKKVNAVVIIYNLCISCKTEEILSLTAHYCTGPDRNNTHTGMLSTTDAGGVYLSKSIMDVVENFGLEKKIVGVNSDGGGNLRVCS